MTTEGKSILFSVIASIDGECYQVALTQHEIEIVIGIVQQLHDGMIRLMSNKIETITLEKPEQ